MNRTTIDGVTYVAPDEASDVTDEMLNLAQEIHDGYFDEDEPMDWEEFIDRPTQYAPLDSPPMKMKSRRSKSGTASRRGRYA